MQNIETRHIATELRMVGERKLTGYAAKYNELSLDLGGFRERIAPGAFTKAIQGDIRSFWDHDVKSIPLGRTKSGTLKLEEDERGLLFELLLPNTTIANDLIQAITRGDVDGISFGFVPPYLSPKTKDRWSDRGTIRTLVEIDLVEISPVNFAAYGNSNFEMALRSREQWLEENQEEPLPTTKRNIAERELEILKARTT